MLLYEFCIIIKKEGEKIQMERRGGGSKKGNIDLNFQKNKLSMILFHF